MLLGGVMTMRARVPDVEGAVQRDGLKIGYEVFGRGEPALLLAGPWPVAHARMWKCQVPQLARRHQVITVDPRGNGRSDRPADPAAYADTALAGDLLAVLDELAVPRAVLVGHCVAAWYVALVARDHPDRVHGLVMINPTAAHLTPPLPQRTGISFDEDRGPGGDVGWWRDNRHSMRRDYLGYLDFYFGEVVSEAHSSKQREDGVGWGLETSPEVLIATAGAPSAARDRAGTEAVLRAVERPTLVIVGDDDQCIPPARGRRIAELIGAEELVLAGAGHLPHTREPVAVNRAIERFAARFAPRPPRRRWVRPQHRERRVLYLSSPIGLGHVRRDLAVARELRARHPDLRIDWLAQAPVAGVLAAHGERVHPASAALASEAAHIESEAGEHELGVFEAFRRMDEILVANFMVFADLVRERHYDLWVGDEAWELDHFLHENPELKRSAYAWLTDFVGWLPAGGDAREAALTTDVNAEMLEQVQRLPRIRDRAIFVGDPDDVVPGTFGPGLPTIREWTRQRYEFCGYITGSPLPADRAALRARLGYRPEDRVCLVTVGGSAVGRHLLRRVAAAHPPAARLVPGLRTVIVTGPRIDPASVPAPPGVQVHGYLPDLADHLAACDVAVVQGGLATTMELTAAGRPFVYVPLGRHCEQTVHVPHRLRRHGAGRELAWAEATPARLAELIAAEVGRETRYRPVPGDGAARAAGLLAELL
jgi:pimeloyl-ACP methyl ester carboxylesterase/predicted glycosyltransferase